MSLAMNITQEEWIAALRSGDYKQDRDFKGHLTLQPQDTHCCLGVACAIAPDVIKIVEEREAAAGRINLFVIYSKETTTKSAGLGELRPEWMSGAQEKACINANDNLNWTFEQIADWWESTGGEYVIKSGAFMPDLSGI